MNVYKKSDNYMCPLLKAHLTLSGRFGIKLTYVNINTHFERKIVNIFLHMYWLKMKELIFNDLVLS